MLGSASRPRASSTSVNVPRLSLAAVALLAAVAALAFGGAATSAAQGLSDPAHVSAPAGYGAPVALIEATGLPSTAGAQFLGPLPLSEPMSGGLEFAPTLPAAQASVLQAALLDELQGQGIQVTQTSPALWNLVGTAPEMGAVFGTSFEQARLNGIVGYAPTGAVSLPSGFTPLGVEISGGFQNVAPLRPAGLVPAPHPLVSTWHTDLAGGPHAALAINLSSPYIIQYQAHNTAIAFPPTNLNETWTLSISGGTAPYSVVWDWGPGSEQRFSTSASSLSNFDSYYLPGQADYCDTVVCGNVTVWVNDSASNKATYDVGLVPGVSPLTDGLFYDAAPLYRMGFSGQSTEVGLNEMCDSSYPNADYTSDLTTYSTMMGLPAPKITLAGTGATSCSGGSQGWSGETLLDMEAVHAIAPNATMVVDLADSNPDEGDCTWDGGTSGIYVSSNSWTGGGTQSCWTTAEKNHLSYQTSSGDCGAFPAGSSDAPTDYVTDVGVGGTQVYPQASGIFNSEFAWNGTFQSSCSNNEGSTGGYSNVAAPAYQTGTTGFTGSARGVPDIAAIGGTWFWMVYEGGVTLSAGTSLACPSWTAMIDLLWQYNSTTAKGQGMMDYSLYNIAKGTNYDTALHDIVVGNNIEGTGPPGFGYTCTVGWDPVTGIGSPDIAKLAEFLATANGNSAGIGAVTAVLAANTTFGPVGLEVDFGADVTGGAATLTGYSYTWAFGDGTTATTSVGWVTHVYAAAGIFWPTVTVTVGANSGTSNGVMVHVTGTGSTGGPLTVSASGSPTSGVAPLAVSFTGSASGGTGPYTYYWGFGDGGNAVTASASHTYTAAGTYTASLTVNDSASHTAVSTPITISVTTAGPLSVTAAGSPTTGTAPLSVGFTSTVTGGNPGYTYAWTFGDGGSSTVANPTHVYSTPGTFSASVGVTDTLSHTATSNTVTVTVSPAPLVVSISATPQSGTAPLVVAFSSTVSGGTSPYTYSWTFGDGGASTVANPSHTYGSAGTYTAILSVMDSSNPVNSASQSLTISVTSSTGVLAATATDNRSAATVGMPISFFGAATGGTSPYAYSWAFGDSASSALQDPSHAYLQPGAYTVTLTVTDAVSSVATSQVSVTISSVPGPLAIVAGASPTSGTVPLPVQFTGTASGGTAPYSYAWAFGDGGTSTAASPSYTYATAGSYVAAVTVTDALGHKANSNAISITVNAQATEQPLTVRLAASPASGPVGQSVSFTTTVTGGSGTYSDYVWSGLPNGCNPANSVSISCSPTTAGSNLVTVEVSDTGGHTASASVYYNVTSSGTSNNNNPSGGILGLSSLDLELLLALVAVVVVGIIVAVAVSRRRKHQMPPPAQPYPYAYPPGPPSGGQGGWAPPPPGR
jgi:PKD repeat protein